MVERCATPNDRDSHLSNLKQKLEDRNYPTELIEKQFKKAKSKDRKSLIFQNRKKKSEKDDKVRFIFTHNQSNPPFHMWIRDCKKVLSRNDKAKDVGSRIQLTSRQPKNLQRLVGGDRGGSGGGRTSPPEAGCKKCKGCHTCPKMNVTKTFRSSNTKKIYKIKQAVDCDSEWVIYLVTCGRCQGQYVGKSKTPFKRRHSNHKCEIKRNYGGLGHHYGGAGPCSYEDLSITIIEQIETKNLETLADREVYWQHQLRAFVQNGGKAHCYRKDI